MTKRERHGAILALVRSQDISTQAELVAALKTSGIEVVQTTVSRDIAELGLVKVRTGEGRLVYALPGTSDVDRLREMRLALSRWAMTMEASGNLVLITTPSGHADPLAEAIDDADHPKVLGTIAGENTVLVVAAEGITGAELRAELHREIASANGPDAS